MLRLAFSFFDHISPCVLHTSLPTEHYFPIFSARMTARLSWVILEFFVFSPKCQMPWGNMELSTRYKKKKTYFGGSQLLSQIARTRVRLLYKIKEVSFSPFDSDILISCFRSISQLFLLSLHGHSNGFQMDLLRMILGTLDRYVCLDLHQNDLVVHCCIMSL